MKKVLKYAALTGALLLAQGQLWAQESKNEAAPGPGFTSPVEGGADAFGYTVTSCNATFFDISATGAAIVNGDDSGSPLQALTGTFNFYGTDIAALSMNTNGFLSTTDDAAGDLSNDCPLPAVPSTGTGARIYALHDDLITTDGFFEYFATCPVTSPNFPGAGLGCHIFQWSGVTHFGGGGPWDFEAVLFDDSYEIVFIQGAGNPEAGSGSTTGIQNLDASIGLTFACDTAASVPDNSAQCFAHPDPDVMVLPPPAEVPTLKTGGILFLMLSLFALAFYRFRRLEA